MNCHSYIYIYTFSGDKSGCSEFPRILTLMLAQHVTDSQCLLCVTKVNNNQTQRHWFGFQVPITGAGLKILDSRAHISDITHHICRIDEIQSSKQV